MQRERHTREWMFAQENRFCFTFKVAICNISFLPAKLSLVLSSVPLPLFCGLLTSGAGGGLHLQKQGGRIDLHAFT